MPIVATFSAEEEAFAAAANLESTGIEATILDRSSLDNSLLGVTAGSAAYAIEVADAKLDRAREILAEEISAGPAATGESIAAATHTEQSSSSPVNQSVDISREKTFFRILVVVELLLVAASEIFSPMLYQPMSPELEEHTASLAASEGVWGFAYQTHYGFLIACLLSNILLFQFLSWGRPLYTGTVVLGILYAALLPPALDTPVGGLLFSIQWMFCGAIIVLMYGSKLSAVFRRRLGDS